MRKFLTVSVCMLVSLMANATVSVTKSADGLADSITISGTITPEEVTAAKAQLKMSSLKIATGNYQLSKEDWKNIINPWGANLIIDKLANLDLSSVRFSEEVMNDDAKNNIGGQIGNHPKITILTWSRYNDIPSQCFCGNKTLVNITIPNKQDGDESITVGDGAFKDMEAMTTLYIGSCVTKVEPNMCECSNAGKSHLNSVFFNTDIKEIPSKSFTYCDALKRIDLPTNTEEIGVGAFENCSLESITFPNTLKTIRKNAFDRCALEYVVIPENVELIETDAFQNNAKLTDVYVMGSKAKCQENGFDKNQNSNNFNNGDYTKGDSEDNPASVEDWKCNDGSGTSPVVLHFVADSEEARKNYENPYYTMLNTEGILDEMKNLDTDEKKDEFVKKYNLFKGFPWKLWDYACDNHKECPFAYHRYKDNDGVTKTVKIWRNEFGYYTDINKINELGTDVAGWKQFLIVQDDAKENTYDDIHRTDDRWYSMCFPFDLNANQIRTAYGAGTEVCEFIGVWNTHTVNEENKEILEFRFKPLLSDMEVECIDNTDEDSRAASPIITYANHAYMIHPASRKENDNTSVWHRIIPGIPADMQIGYQDKLHPTIPEKDFDKETMSRFDDGEAELLEGFQFIGNYEKDVKLPAESYYFTYRDYEDGARSLVLNHLTKQSRYDWTPMTALVRPYDNGKTTANYAKKLSFSFTVKKSDQTTGIEDVMTNGSTQVQDAQQNKVYNLNGQEVKRGGNLQGLSKGIYIMNGKKYIVK